MKSEQYITIQGWMRTELKLKGNDLLVYAIIYGFSQDGEQRFTGSLQYLADWCGSTKQGIQKNLKNLLDRGLIEKFEVEKSGVKFCEYSCILCNSVVYPMQLSCTNNIEYTNSISNYILSKDNIITGDEWIGDSKPKKKNRYDQCIEVIDRFTDDEELKQSLKLYLEFRLDYGNQNKENFYVGNWKGLLRKLERQFKPSEYLDVVNAALEHGWKSFYNPYSKKTTNYIDTAHTEKYTEEELEELERSGHNVKF